MILLVQLKNNFFNFNEFNRKNRNKKIGKYKNFFRSSGFNVYFYPFNYCLESSYKYIEFAQVPEPRILELCEILFNEFNFKRKLNDLFFVTYVKQQNSNN